MDIEAIRQEVERQVLQYFHMEHAMETDGARIPARDVASHLEHSLLNPDLSLKKLEEECRKARRYAVAAVCVAPYYVPAAREILQGSPVAVGTAVGFPHGCMSQAAKLAEIKECMENGATEIDVALNILAIKSGRLDTAQREIEEIVRFTAGKAKVKIQNMFSGKGADVNDVRFARDILGRFVEIKIDGGIKTLAQAQALLAAGASRLGLTATVKIAEEAQAAE